MVFHHGLFELHSRNLAQEQVAHTHDFHQLILATCGVTELSMEGQGNGSPLAVGV
ncbi:hypothetical protein HSBAA_09490 [Vreelandella sulfidaeris]|uniref:Uncharacterized protein n=1 Tax=Vreelandella sulfidaeris TaxID=115553 RepID=A0A455U383_9GAMM|nr:hypothetical protein HSBAA_09490 [Halomonas sulfidaeris]